jgi:mannan endo-1,4-beta-mannosidase
MSATADGRSHRDDFVTVRGTAFRLDGRSYHFVGANYWQAMNLASRGPGGDRQQLLRELDDMKAHGITNLRIMAASEGPDTEPLRMVPALLEAPGVYNADLLDGLDFALKALGDRDMKAVMTMGNMWHWSGGFGQYLVWAGVGSLPYPPPRPGGDWDGYQRFVAQFYGNARAVSYYLDHVAKIVTRVNPYTKTAYRDDPTIMAWELANEPRALSNVDAYLGWIATSAQLIKSLDHNHLVTIGSEGDTSEPSYSGTEYLRDHSLSAIDYGTAHVWAQNWGWYDPQQAVTTYAPAVGLAKAYIDSHVSRTLTLDKPIVFEEFGFARDLNDYSPASPVTVRDPYYAEIFGHLYAFAKNNAVAGTNFWGYAGESRPVPPFGLWWQPGNSFLADPPHEPQGWYSVYNSDASTLAVVKHFARLMSDLDYP